MLEKGLTQLFPQFQIPSRWCPLGSQAGRRKEFESRHHRLYRGQRHQDAQPALCRRTVA